MRPLPQRQPQLQIKFANCYINTVHLLRNCKSEEIAIRYFEHDGLWRKMPYPAYRSGDAITVAPDKVYYRIKDRRISSSTVTDQPAPISRILNNLTTLIAIAMRQRQPAPLPSADSLR